MQYVGNGNLVWDLGLAGTLGNLVVIVELRVGFQESGRKFKDLLGNWLPGICEILLGCGTFGRDLGDLVGI